MNESGDDHDGQTEVDTEHREEYGVDRDWENDRDGSQAPDRPTVDLEDETSSSPEPSAAPSTAGGSEPPDPETVRNWTGLTLALAAISFVTAITIFAAYDTPTAAGGAALLGLGFGSITVVGRTTTPVVFSVLDDAWTEHRIYVWFSTGLFALGALIGVLLYAAGVNLVDLLLEMIMQELGEDELPSGAGDDPTDEVTLDLSASFFIINNTPPFLAAIFGALTLGLFTFAIMVFNGVIIGNIAVVTGMEAGFGIIIALIVPHGIFELPALFIAAGVGFRFIHRVGQRIVGSRDALFTKAYLVRTTALVVFAWLILVLAAFVEAYVTFLIAETLFPNMGA